MATVRRGGTTTPSGRSSHATAARSSNLRAMGSSRHSSRHGKASRPRSESNGRCANNVRARPSWCRSGSACIQPMRIAWAVTTAGPASTWPRGWPPWPEPAQTPRLGRDHRRGRTRGRGPDRGTGVDHPEGGQEARGPRRHHLELTAAPRTPRYVKSISLHDPARAVVRAPDPELPAVLEVARAHHRSVGPEELPVTVHLAVYVRAAVLDVPVRVVRDLGHRSVARRHGRSIAHGSAGRCPQDLGGVAVLGAPRRGRSAPSHRWRAGCRRRGP